MKRVSTLPSRIECTPPGGNAAALARIPFSWLAGVLLSAMILALIGGAQVQAATYKWTDDKGVVHYTDKIPPEALNKGNVQLNKEGVPVKRTDPTLTPEQRRAKEVEEERARQAARERELVDRRDRALQSTYTTEGEIDLARSRALATIDAQVQTAANYSALLTKRKAELETSRASGGDKQAPGAIERELASINVALEGQTNLIAAKLKESAIVTARYEADKKRWQELRSVSETSARGAGNVVPTATAPPK